ncbi:MAG: RidA family protein [Rhodothermales bacterium]|nr:RidA family protein [Rhodothermales bacterium]
MKSRRSFMKRAGAWMSALGVGTVAVSAGPADERPRAGEVITHDDIPLFSSTKAFGNLLFVSGIGAHFEGDIKAHTDHVLTEMKKRLEDGGSSMEKVLKVNVYLHDLSDYTAMNEVFRGRFGENPPVRTTVACYGGIPGDSLVEIDCIAALD